MINIESRFLVPFQHFYFAAIAKFVQTDVAVVAQGISNDQETEKKNGVLILFIYLICGCTFNFLMCQF